VLSLGLAATAAASPRTVAREAYKEGTKQFEIGNYAAALDAFKRAYLAYEEPAFLFNMAQCERLLGQTQEALRTYKMFNKKVPDAPNHEEVEKTIVALQQQLDQERAAAEKPMPAPEPTPAPAAAAPVVQTQAPPPKPPPKPLVKRWWFWTAIGAGVVAAVAIGVGVGLGTKTPDFNPTLPDVGPGRSALTVGH
jgi:tetratricopeptide (TPR) repeat protein